MFSMCYCYKERAGRWWECNRTGHQHEWGIYGGSNLGQCGLCERVRIMSSIRPLLSDFWEKIVKEENTWELASAVQHLRKHISLFYKDHLDKPTATSPTIDTLPPMARPITRPIEPLKQKQGQPTRRTKKCAKWDDKEEVIRRNPSQFGFQ